MLAQSRQQGLLVDDDQSTREMISILLRPLGLSLVTLETGYEALPLIRPGRFDLYIVDVWLPGMSGFTLSQKIKSIDPATRILFYSGAGTLADIERAQKTGADGYVIKPDIVGLVSTVQELLCKGDFSYRGFRSNPDCMRTAAAVS